MDDPIVIDMLARPRLATLFAARPGVTVDDAIAELHTRGASLLEASCSCLEKALAAVEDEFDRLIETCELLLSTSSPDDLAGPQAR